MDKLFQFNFTQAEAETLLTGLKKLPFEQVEILVQKLIFQFNNQPKSVEQPNTEPTIIDVVPEVIIEQNKVD